MRISPPEPNIGSEDGFDPSKDIFGRVELGKGLKHLFENSSEPLFVALDGPWGSGKSVFLKMLSGELKKHGFSVIYFDAFENDYITDAFAALSGELVDCAKGSNKGGVLKERTLAAGKVIVRSGIQLAASAAARVVVGTAIAEKIADEIAKETGEAADKILEDVISNRKEQKSTIERFKESLSEFADTNEANKPLIFIIDEIDRCRPSFSIEILERVKHFMSVDNVHFLLGVNLQQLEVAVANYHGIGTNAYIYLQKFFNIVVPLSNRGSRPM